MSQKEQIVVILLMVRIDNALVGPGEGGVSQLGWIISYPLPTINFPPYSCISICGTQVEWWGVHPQNFKSEF